jgi:hypothetical protein
MSSFAIMRVIASRICSRGTALKSYSSWHSSRLTRSRGQAHIDEAEYRQCRCPQQPIFHVVSVVGGLHRTDRSGREAGPTSCRHVFVTAFGFRLSL